MWAEQAIFTSILRQGRGGYHLIARSPGVGDEDAHAISRWSPSHGSLDLDAENSAGVSFYALPSGRFALARSCEGPPEYSGRGGLQLYTHTLVLDEKAMNSVGWQPLAAYQNAMAVGALIYDACPPISLRTVRIPELFVPLGPKDWEARGITLKLPPLRPIRDRILAGRPIQVAHAGDRVDLATCLLGMLTPELRRKVSFAASLQPSTVRPFLLSIVRPERQRP
ncbi:GAP1-N2 domain-containing protein [Aquisphaera insulae]|uniref:GAP1-N2 domain-containing protein n=1 Tax=Aquisphaera insulae TaxID=2712864 RepID=UPI0013EBD303|nr:hypothetical protein [Aquisphaera insulae]